MDKLYIVMPAYNEEENIREVVRSWYACLEGKDAGSRLVVADSGSSDLTHKYLKSMQREMPQLEILTDTMKQHGPKLMALYRYAIGQGADYVFQTDSDGQTLPQEFPQFWDKREKYDVVLANRPVRGDGKARAIVEKVVCLLLKIYFGVKVQDANAPFRLMKAEVLEKYLDRLPEDYNIPNIMFTTYFAYYKNKMKFIDITFRPRKAGKNSINLGKIFVIGWKALGDFRRFKKAMH
ncbi:MAG: glycosyltransferase family 2 protein [Lachnospiraceae bacterium]|nr:glycosyltransferase family 2 protein [Lachnospiraceae bacterium]MBR6158243.1 glycosyltransferase family 2 protein [Lachnospiraceae bacterium]